MDAKQFYNHQISIGNTNVFDIMDKYATHCITEFTTDHGVRDLMQRQQNVINHVNAELKQLRRELADVVETELEDKKNHHGCQDVTCCKEYFDAPQNT
jgi:hypothetical protein